MIYIVQIVDVLYPAKYLSYSKQRYHMPLCMELPKEPSICSFNLLHYTMKGGDIMDPVITRIVVEAPARFNVFDCR